MIVPQTHSHCKWLPMILVLGKDRGRMSDFSCYKKGYEKQATAESRAQAAFLLSCGNLGNKPSTQQVSSLPTTSCLFLSHPIRLLISFLFHWKAFPPKTQLIPWRTTVTLNTVHLSSLPRYPLGITVDYTTNGVRPISG